MEVTFMFMSEVTKGHKGSSRGCVIMYKTQFTIYQVCSAHCALGALGALGAVEEGVLVKLYLKAACFTYTQYTCLREVIMMYKRIEYSN